MARMVTAHPALESGLVVVRRSAYIFIQPFVESVLQGIDVPARALIADIDDGALRESPNDGIEQRQIAFCCFVCGLERLRTRCRPADGFPFLMSPLPYMFTFDHVNERFAFGSRLHRKGETREGHCGR